jgi:tetratricopeptide (TPR) repeat protein
LAWVALTNQQHKAHNPSALGFRQYAELAGIGVVGVVSIFWIISFIAADLHYSQGVTYLSQGDYPEAAIKLKNALSLHHEHVYEDRYSTALANIALLVAYSQKPEEAENYVFLSRYYSSRALEQSPQNALYWRSKGKNEYTFYQAKTDEAYINEAIKDIDKAYKFAPTDPKLPYTLGLLYGATNRREQSMRYMDQTIALKPDYLDAYLLKLKLLKAWKEDEQVKTLKTQIKSRFPMLPEKRLDEEFE